MISLVRSCKCFAAEYESSWQFSVGNKISIAVSHAINGGLIAGAVAHTMVWGREAYLLWKQGYVPSSIEESRAKIRGITKDSFSSLLYVFVYGAAMVAFAHYIESILNHVAVFKNHPMVRNLLAYGISTGIIYTISRCAAKAGLFGAPLTVSSALIISAAAGLLGNIGRIV